MAPVHLRGHALRRIARLSAAWAALSSPGGGDKFGFVPLLAREGPNRAERTVEFSARSGQIIRELPARLIGTKSHSGRLRRRTHSATA